MIKEELEKEAEEYVKVFTDRSHIWSNDKLMQLQLREAYKDGAEFGYDKGKEELTERLDNAAEIIELMKDLFFDCWQEKGIKAIKFEQRVNNFLKGE